MRLYSTQDRNHLATFAEAVDRGMAPDGGLYMPLTLPLLPPAFLEACKDKPFVEISTELARRMLEDDLPAPVLESIVTDAFSFPVPLRVLDENLTVLELFHGPTLAFKDFGARFMARVLSWLHRADSREIIILVATSGDTGSAVAHGFAAVEGVRVVLLYPAGRVSSLQELQLTTAGDNVTTLSVEGTFDDCQRLVKRAFADPEVRRGRTVTSANSINIARLLPQAFYFVSSWARARQSGRDITFVVPSGNLGNLTAGLMASAMGMRAKHFVGATNINDVVTHYLRTGEYRRHRAVRTISNAMDVGDPSNLVRIRSFFQDDRELMNRVLTTRCSTDEETRSAAWEAFERYQYVFDPHGAIGYRAARHYLREQKGDTQCVVLATAHPAKFPEVLTEEMQTAVEVPEAIQKLRSRPRRVSSIGANYGELREVLTSE